MANKLQAYAKLADHAARQITASYQEWTAFLDMAGRLYKYPFSEQLMIYAQRPDATACADYDLWKERMGRYVRQGSRGIGIIDISSGKPVLRYVYDVADTGGEETTRPQLWEYQEEHRDVVSAALARRFETPAGEGGLSEQLEAIASQLMADYWYEHKQDILDIVDGSFLAEYDAYNIGVQFKTAAAVSMTYVLLSRCGLEAEHFFHHEDFLNVFDFNTPDTLTELGTAVSQGSEAVLRQIEVTIKKYERERSAERSAEHGEHADLYTEGGHSDPRPDPGGAAGPGPGQVREDAPDVSEGAPSGAAEPPDAERDAVQPPAGDRGHSQQQVGADDAGAGKGGGGDGAVEGQRHDDVGGPDELLQGPGGGNHPVRADLQLNEPNQPAQEGPSAEAPGPSSISQAEIDAILRDYPGRMRIFTLYQHGISAKDAVAALKKEYGYSGGNHTFLDGASGMVNYRPDTGLTLQRYQPQAEVTVKWPTLEKRIRQLIQEGSYLASDEIEKYESDHLEDAPEQEAEVLDGSASSLISELESTSFQMDYNALKESHPGNIVVYQIGDAFEIFGPDARVSSRELDLRLTTYIVPGLGRVAMCGFPIQELERNMEKLREKHAVTVSAIVENSTRRQVSTFPPLAQTPGRTGPTARESTAVHAPGAAPPIPATVPPREITPADIDAALQEWNGDMDSKRRVQQYMADHARDRATAEWLKNEYGDDLPAFPVTVEGAATDLPWTKVQRRLALLLKEDRFFTQAELDNFEDIDPAAVREQLESGVPSPFVEQVMADVERLAGQEAEQEADAAPTVREIYEKYKPMVIEKVLADQAYQNACKNSDQEAARMEGGEAVNRAALSIMFPDGTTAVIGAEDFTRLYFDMADFRLRLHREVVDETYPILSQAPDLSGQPIAREGDTLTIGEIGRASCRERV